MERKNETFTYTYSAKEQEEIKNIREKYATPIEHEAKIEQLRRLDKSTTRSASIISLTVGILSTLIMGIGMCCTMLSGWEEYFVLGILIGVVGIIGIIAAYPIYNHIVKRNRKKLAPEIMRLADELMK